MTRLPSGCCLTVALFAALAGSPTPAAADTRPVTRTTTDDSPQDIYRKSIGGVVWIENHLEKDSITGTGFLVDAKRKLVVTNYHLALDEETMDVFFPVRDKAGKLIGDPKFYQKNIESLRKTGHYSAGRVVARAPNKDLVVLVLESLPASAVQLDLADNDPEAGDVLHMLGNPAGRELWRWGPAVKPRLGTFRGKYNNFPVEMNYKQITYGSNSFGGNSGGPVLNDAGKVVGVHSSGGGEGGMNGGAVHYSEVAELLNTFTQYRSFSIENPTNVTLHYQVRWGDGEWKESKLEPGKVMTHWLKGDGPEEVVKFRFDRSAQEGYQEKVYTLDYRTVDLGLNVLPSPDYDAKVYYFKYDKGGQNLDLYAKKK